MQFDADTVGSASPAADAEICMMAADCLEALGIQRGDYVIKVNNRKVLDGVMEAIGLGREANVGRRLTVMRAIDKLDRLGLEGVRLLLGSGRKDESGDFTKGAGLGEMAIEQVLALLRGDGGVRFGDGVEGKRPPAGDGLSGGSRVGGAAAGDAPAQGARNEGLQELAQIESFVRGAGYGSDRIRIDPSVVRGLEYYTGPVFEAELTFEVKDDDGRPVRFGSVGGGGRYDGLVARFRAEPVPATGFSIGVSRLLAALRAIKSPIVAAAETTGPVVVLALDRDADSMANYQRLVASLRNSGIAAELYLGSGGMNAQLKYADRRRSRVAVIQGSNERNAAGGSQVTIRDLKLGAELAKSTKDRADYLELRQRAQFPAPEAELVERVREVLARG
jgi:histidyl-tRNA synthetase